MYDSDQDSLEVYAEDNNLDGSSTQILINSYLTDYPTIVGATVTVDVLLEINPCVDIL